ncbi:MAG: ABC transporter permease [Candidatus Woesearchaeota archaeon]
MIFGINIEVIFGLWLRQVKRYYRSKSRFIAALGQPILFLIALSYGFGPVFQRAGGINYLQFLVPGIMGMSILTTSLMMGIELIWDRQFGILKETLVAPVSRLKIMIGRTIGGATVGIIQGLIIFLISLIFGFKPIINYVWIAVIFAILTSFLFSAFGTLIATLLQDMQGFQLIMNFVVMPMVFLSGALFPLENLPKSILGVVRINPLSYCVDGLRQSLSGIHHFGILSDLLILIPLTSILLIIGSWAFSRMQV